MKSDPTDSLRPAGIRVEASHGVLRIVVPDAATYCRVVLQENWDEASALRDITRYRTLMEMLNDVFRQEGQHLYAYDERTLHLVLEQSGFEDVQHMNFGCSRTEGLAIEQAWRAAESLHMEAVNPSS